VKLTKLVSLCK